MRDMPVNNRQANLQQITPSRAKVGQFMPKKLEQRP
jgi:hypothetical protein